MVSSIDGRLLVDSWTPLAEGIDHDIVHLTYHQVAALFKADGRIVGPKSKEGYSKGRARAPRTIPDDLRAPHVGDRRDRDIAVAMDPHGRLHYGWDDAGGDHFVAVLGEQVSDGYLAELREDGVSYLFVGPDGHDLHRAMDILGDTFGIGTLLLEGGGTINGAFLNAGLIDEISILMYPGIDGLAGVPSIFGYDGTDAERPAAGRSLRHLATETLEGGMVWLHYAVAVLLLASDPPDSCACSGQRPRTRGCQGPCRVDAVERLRRSRRRVPGSCLFVAWVKVVRT